MNNSQQVTKVTVAQTYNYQNFPNKRSDLRHF